LHLKRSISIAKGKGSIGHNSRNFKAENVDPERTQFNTCYVNENIHQVYHKLFDTALEEYNAKQKRTDRKIPDYYEKIRTSKQEKLFYEIIVQVGNFEDMSATDENGKIAEEILHKYMQNFQNRNPTLYVFSAHLHMDEATPHLHIDFVPYIDGNKRGLETKNSMKGALEKLCFMGGTRGSTELTQWQDSEKEKLSEIMLEHDIEWEKKCTHRDHRSVLDFKREKRAEEVAELEQISERKQVEIKQLQENIIIEKSTLKEVKSKNAKIKDVDDVTVQNTLLNSNKVVLNKAEFEEIKLLAKKQIASDKKEKNLVSDNKKLVSEVKYLKKENEIQKQELNEFKSVKNQLNIHKVIAENEQLKAFKKQIVKFLEVFNLKEQFNKFIPKDKEKER